MSAWRLIVRELYERGPLTAAEFTSCAPTNFALRTACDLGAIERPGPKGSPYRITPMGVRIATNRTAWTARNLAHVPGKVKGSTNVLRPTWLASLPSAGEIRLSGAPA